MRRAALLLLLIAAGWAAPLHAQDSQAQDDRCSGPVRPELPLYPDDTLTLGPGVSFVAGAVLAGPCAEGFGGFSAMVVDDGLHITAASDRGNWLWVQLGIEDGAISLTSGALDPIAGSDAEGRHGRCQGLEAEGLSRFGDVLLMTFDTSGIVLAFDPETLERRAQDDRPPLPLLRPGANEGYEAIAPLPEGGLIALRERESKRLPTRAGDWRPAPQRVWTQGRGPWVERQVYIGPPQPHDVNQTRVSDAATLPDGRLLLLETSWRPETGNFTRVLHARFAGDALHAELPPLLSIAPGPLADNFEALATVRTESMGTLLLMMSDDNLNTSCVPNRNQRTKLLVFRLEE